VITLLEHNPDRQAVADKASATLGALPEIGAVLIRTAKFGPVWLAIDPATADEIRTEEQQREKPCPVLTPEDVAHLENKSVEAIRGALEIIRAFPGARIIH
jgi:hypothetical protein